MPTEKLKDYVLDIFQNCQRYCVEIIYHTIFVPFRYTSQYDEMCDAMLHHYNSVSMDDFDYFGVIGEGGFGVVLHCRKKSTGIHYAAKVQTKAGLLRHFRKNPANVALEMKACAQCHHPYLTSLSYACQSPTLTTLVMPLSTYGDLNRAIALTINNRLPLDRARFYAAEIASGLMYLHDHSIMYRDLKPGNVLLNGDGHISLADFGSLADVGKVLRIETNSPKNGDECDSSGFNSNESSYSFTRDTRTRSHIWTSNPALGNTNGGQSGGNSPPDSEKVTPGNFAKLSGLDSEELAARLITNKKSEDSASIGSTDIGSGARISKGRTTSLVGTLAYMAPEVLIKCSKGEATKGSYTDAVDWWALGCTLYKLLTGFEPFRILRYERIASKLPTLLTQMSYEEAFTQLFGQPEYELYQHIFTDDAVDFIKSLLSFSSEKRLGNDQNSMNGQESIKNHPFFNGIDWDLLNRKKIIPPYIPDLEMPDQRLFSFGIDDDYDDIYTFNEIILRCGRGCWLDNDNHHDEITKDSKKTTSMEMSNSTNMKINKSKYVITNAQQAYFNEWSYVSPQCIELETAALAKQSDEKKPSGIISWLSKSSLK
eukprot:TRINITY_DN64766_c6_g2_i1.p1 TRINITY_DN64766_c6_g2~~TRINITY_DN64766_c6_g2_i1.p1  ORF type:complete len:683 (+),score=-28.83 TRINITY_DN64766_c6_g2_i1:261-2051(+)